MKIYTIGYGNRAIGDFLDLLRRYGIQTLVDTRSIPYSRFRPAYRKQAFAQSLSEASFEYLYLGDALGGKLVPDECKVNGVIDLDLLAEHAEFKAALAQVQERVRQGHVLALMCAELRPDACHRAWMLGKLLHERGFEVLHIDERGDLKTQVDVMGFL
jgi:uncharacterized protein (DUF488 family)